VKTTCPGCATTFRVTPEQLAARGGKVRCGKCQAVFNANGSSPDKGAVVSPADALPDGTRTATATPTPTSAEPAELAVPEPPTAFFVPESGDNEPYVPAETVEPFAASAVGSLAQISATPRETNEVPGYSKWSERAIDSPSPATANKAFRWPFLLVGLLLGATLAGQVLFHFRSQAAVAVPDLRPFLETLSDMMGTDIPLLRHAELISIETSDLQADPKRAELLALHATLRNRAAHEQGYPALQLSLTDTQDNVIARRVFLPGEYLPPQNLTPLIFAANAEIPVSLWIEAKEISAAGYRLYAFYP